MEGSLPLAASKFKSTDVISLLNIKDQQTNGNDSFPLKDNEAGQSKKTKPLPSIDSAQPKKYIAPHLRNCSGAQEGNDYKRTPLSRLRLPWRVNKTSPKRYNEKIHDGKNSNCTQWKDENSASLRVHGKTLFDRSNRKCNRENWRSKNKSPPLGRSVPIRNILTLKGIDNAVRYLNSMISLKIFGEKNALVDELIVPCNQLISVKRKFPKLFHVVPSTDKGNKVLQWNADAVKVFLRCVFSTSYTLPCWEIALEAFALAKKFQNEELQAACKDFFDFKPISAGHVQDVVQLARKLRITDVLKSSLMFAVHSVHVKESAIKVTSKKPHCSVSCITIIEPSEFCIPLDYTKERGLANTKKSDVQNDIIFKALTGSFCITGFQIKLEAESKDLGKELSIFCDLFKSKVRVFGEERLSPLRNIIIVNFTQKLLVKPKEDVIIKVVIEDLCLRLCHCLNRDKELGRSSTGIFQTIFISDKKTEEAKQALFFVEKLFYIYEGQKN